MKTSVYVWVAFALVLNAAPGHGQSVTAPVPIPVPISEAAPAPAAPVPEPPSMSEPTSAASDQIPPWSTNSPMVATNDTDSASETNAAEMVGPLPWFANGFTNDQEIQELVNRRDDSTSQLKQAQDDEAKAQTDYQKEAQANSDAQYTALEKENSAMEKVVDLMDEVRMDNLLIKERIIRLLAADLNENWAIVETNAPLPEPQTSFGNGESNSLNGAYDGAGKGATMPDAASGGAMNPGSSFDNSPGAPNDSSAAPRSAAPIPIPIDPQK